MRLQPPRKAAVNRNDAPIKTKQLFALIRPPFVPRYPEDQEHLISVKRCSKEAKNLPAEYDNGANKKWGRLSIFYLEDNLLFILNKAENSVLFCFRK